MLNPRILALATLLTTLAPAQDPDRPQSRPGGPPPGSPPSLPAGMTEEQMWPSPTEEDWAKPVQIEFERSWEDALTVSQETGKPILICINMDGEIASEHYAGIKYRDPEYAKYFKDYVCVIASVYRHTPRDHDEHGNRILCPRLGSVTCGEHIAIEPVLYEKYMDGQRISPRHIMVELDGKETYDVFYAWDVKSVFTTLEKGIADRPPPPPVVRGDRTIIERVASRAIADRKAVEKAYRDGDKQLRQQLLEAARENPDAAPVDLLRLSVFGLDADLAKIARDALAKIDEAGAVDLISEALAVPIDDGERENLVAALERISGKSPQARLLANVHRGLSSTSKTVDVSNWSNAMQGGGSYAPPPDRTALESEIAAREAAVRTAPAGDAQAQLELAEASLAFAVDPETRQSLSSAPRTGRRYTQLMFEDARRQVLEAQRLGAKGWRVEAVLALCAWYLGEEDESYEHAIKAMDDMPANPQEWNAVATLALFAKARQKAIWDALRAKEDWPREWMTDVNSVYSVLARHPLGNDQYAVTHYDFLNSLGARARARRVLEEGLERFPDSWKLHDRMRERILSQQGVDGLEPAYEAMLAKEGASKNLHWFAGLTSIVAAEFYRRRGNLDDANGAYDRAIAHYEAAIEANPETEPTSDHYIAIAMAGKSRIAIEKGDLTVALDLLIGGFERHPEATDDLDGLNISPAMTAKVLKAGLEEAERSADVARLQSALDALDPVLLEPPEFERVNDPPAGRQGRGGRRGGRGRRGGGQRGQNRRRGG